MKKKKYVFYRETSGGQKIITTEDWVLRTWKEQNKDSPIKRKSSILKHIRENQPYKLASYLIHVEEQSNDER